MDPVEGLLLQRKNKRKLEITKSGAAGSSRARKGFAHYEEMRFLDKVVKLKK